METPELKNESIPVEESLKNEIIVDKTPINEKEHRFTDEDLASISSFKDRIRRRSELEKFTLPLFVTLINAYISMIKTINKINQEIISGNPRHKLIRNINPLSEITENIAIYAWAYYHQSVPMWGIKNGDLNVYDEKNSKRLIHIEVKAFTSNGPISYGPTESWGVIMYVDLRVFMETGILTVYQLNETNSSDLFQNLPVKKPSATEKGTFGEQAMKGRRPRLAFEPTRAYFGERLICIFNGSLEELLSRVPQ
jgi:hypothetical protein